MEQNRQKDHELAVRSIPSLIWKFAMPSVISLVVNALYNIVDQIFIGQNVGYLGNAATNVIFPIMVLSAAFATLMGDGGAALYSLSLGKKDEEGAKETVTSAIGAVTIMSLAFFVLGFLFRHPLIELFGGQGNVLPYALDYGTVIILGLPFVMISMALSSMIRADGSPTFSMITMLTGALLNVVLDWLFVVVYPFGVAGAAWATIIGQFANFLLCVWYIPRFKQIEFGWKDLVPKWSKVVEIAKYGVSSFITQIALMLVVAVNNNLIVATGKASKYGADIPLAAFGVSMKVNNILNSITIGIAVGSQPIIGYNYGAGRMDRVKKTYLMAVTASMAFMGIGFLIFQFRPMWILNLFGQEDALYNEFAIKCFRIFLSMVILNGFQITTSIFFQAIGEAKKASFISLSRQVLFFIPFSLMLTAFMGINGILLSGPTADLLAFLVALLLVWDQFRKPEFRTGVSVRRE